jgi:hypothetical protein
MIGGKCSWGGVARLGIYGIHTSYGPLCTQASLAPVGQNRKKSRFSYGNRFSK